jgi:hypothetical protein
VTRRIFTYEEAIALLPEVQRLTAATAERLEELTSDDVTESEKLIGEWAESMIALGLEVKGLWLVDFDSGAGFYCWRHPEPALEYYHGYDEGFSGRVKLN